MDYYINGCHPQDSKVEVIHRKVLLDWAVAVYLNFVLCCQDKTNMHLSFGWLGCDSKNYLRTFPNQHLGRDADLLSRLYIGEVKRNNPALTTMGDTKQIEMILSLSRHPRWPR